MNTTPTGTATKKPLATFRHLPQATVAWLEGLKVIIRVVTPRTCQWWLVLPATGQGDATCLLIEKCHNSSGVTRWIGVERRIIKEYQARMDAATA